MNKVNFDSMHANRSDNRSMQQAADDGMMKETTEHNGFKHERKR